VNVDSNTDNAGAGPESGPALVIRPLDERDSIAELTDLLHRSYRALADMGLRFFATHQTEKQTLERVSSGRCYVALLNDRLVGTITYYGPKKTSAASFYRRDDVAFFGQFAVAPELQGRGFGNELLAHVESIARGEDGITELALDTAEPASHLIEYYARHGYTIVEHVQWSETNYRSVVMSKRLSDRDRAS
jgi:GNAT superfamily N-acetyltransferase